MNYFAHGRHYVDDPYFLAGTAVPDWLNVVDRRVRVRSRQAEPHCASADSRLARLAAGIVQHHRDDAWFHGTRAFAELSLSICRTAKGNLGADDGFRPHFLGHILVELLLDATLIAQQPHRLDAYYAALDQIEPQSVQDAVALMSGQTADQLAAFIPLFSRERFLSDYADDATLCFRLNQVMRRVKLPLLPPRFVEVLGVARELVAQRRDDLLTA
jgi:hypothetical protein